MVWTPPALLLLACAATRIDVPGDTGHRDTDTPGPTDTDVERVGGTDTRDDPPPELFQDDEMPVFRLEISDAGWEELLRQTAEDRWYVEADLVVDGERWPSIGVRTKGENSWRPIQDKASLKLKFDFIDSDLEFYGRDELTLQAMNEDLTMVHERLAYRLYREAQVPAARTQHATVVINDESYGLYTHLETVDKPMMARWFDDDDGPLWEVWDVDFQDEYIPYFQLEYGDDDRTRLQATADAMEAEPAEALAAVTASFDLDLFLRYWAVGAYVGQYDAYPYRGPGDDCHVYDDPVSGQLKIIPHGLDETWYDPGRVVWDGVYGLMGAVCLQVPSCFEAFEAQVFEVVQLAEEVDLLGYFDRVQAQVQSAVEADTHKAYSTEDVALHQAAMREMMVRRRAELEGQFGR